MSKKQIIKIIALLLFLVFALFLLLKPYNQLCRGVNWCNPVSFSYLLPALKGEKEIKFNFKAKNDYENVKFKVLTHNSISLRSGSKFTVDYEVINNSSEEIQVRPMRFFNNPKILDYLEFYECLCFQTYKVGPNKKKILSIRFRLKKDIDQSDFRNNDDIDFGYRMMVE